MTTPEQPDAAPGSTGAPVLVLTPQPSNKEGMMTDTSRGIWDKFEVHRTDPEADATHADDKFFVLNLTTDPAARVAALAYAKEVKHLNPVLAKDLEDLVSDAILAVLGAIDD